MLEFIKEEFGLVVLIVLALTFIAAMVGIINLDMSTRERMYTAHIELCRDVPAACSLHE